MGNHQQRNNTIVQVGSLRKNDGGIESNVNYIQMEEHKGQVSQTRTNRNQRDRVHFFYWLNKFNCIQGMRNRSLPDWLGHAKVQLSQNQRYTQHHWASELLMQVQKYSGYKNQQSQSISEIQRASEKSYFDSTEYLARRKDNWMDSSTSGSNRSSFSSSSSYTNEMRKQVVIQREKKLQDIIENTELLRESLQEERNSFFQINSQERARRISDSANNSKKQAGKGQQPHEEMLANTQIGSNSSKDNNVDGENIIWENDEDLTDEQQQREEEEYDKMFRNLNRYKEITRVLLKNLANVAKNPIAFLLSSYVEVFCYTYDSNKLSQPSVYLKVITEEVNDFLAFLSDLLRVYYKLDYIIDKRTSSPQAQENKDTSDMFLSSDNIHNFLCTALFSFDGFYRKISKLFSEAGEKADQQLKSQIDKKQNITMGELGIRKEFHLDKQTILQQSSLPSSESSKSAAYYYPQHNSQHPPYATAIEDFKRVSITKAPLQKLKIILKTYETIEQTIKEFYESSKIPMTLSCDADNFLGIIQFIIIKSKAYNIQTDLKLVESFVKNNSSKSSSSYKLITLQGSIVHISTSL